MSRVEIQVKGLDALFSDLEKLSAGGDDVVVDTINDVVLETHANAVRGLNSGPATGRIYKRGNTTHQASAPGEYPMSDTGRLASSTKFILATDQRRVGKVGTDIQYGAHLEFGTSRMKSRPWLLPSFKKAIASVAKDLRRRLEARL